MLSSPSCERGLFVEGRYIRLTTRTTNLLAWRSHGLWKSPENALRSSERALNALQIWKEHQNAMPEHMLRALTPELCRRRDGPSRSGRWGWLC
jgi:hypothetical protein